MNISDFNFQVAGNENGPWLVFLHGLLGSKANWRRITPAFENDFRILTFDQRGHGRSFRPKNEVYDLGDFVTDLEFLFENLKIEKANILGHSLGGRVATLFTAKNPDKVTKLVLEDIGPESAKGVGDQMIQMLKEIPVPFANRAEMQNYFLGDFANRKVGAFLAMNMGVNQNGLIDWNINLEGMVQVIHSGQTEDLWKEFFKIECPILVLRAEHSEYLPPRIFSEMQKNPHVRPVEIKNAGHWLHTDQPENFISEVRKFLTV
jgi:esterase